ncbi:MAG TPA: TIR domain-containing protein [Kofleriaceae bacterium]|nr:TIR domain-containing protein [Kofleriaceae bacterium]
MARFPMSSTPLSIYLLWHPDASDATALASEVYRWFHAPSDDLLRSGLGVPVFFRSKLDGTERRTPRIHLAEADLNVIVVLGDANMVSDPAWTSYLATFKDSDDAVLTVPVALHPSAYRLPEALRRLNFLRVDERDDPPADPASLHQRRTARLLRQLTELVGRELAARVMKPKRGERRSSPPPLAIFLSHAKRDGVKVAAALRATVQNIGRVRAFFDESDLPVGHAFAAELEGAAVEGTAAMIAIVSDAYAARPWCRQEIALARRPRRDEAGQRRWWIQPVLVVDALESAPTRSIPELGNTTLVRWVPAGAIATLDLLMLEVLLGNYHRLRARRIAAAPGRHVISWIPDVPTLLELQRAAGGRIAEVVYPGHGLPRTEIESLARLFPSLALRTFEQVERSARRSPAARAHAVRGRVVGLSAGFHDALGALGLGREHIEEITLRIARCILEVGGRIAFGGMLNTSGLTETLLTLARTVTGDDAAVGAPRLLSYQRWPSLPTREQIAEDAGICEYVSIEDPSPIAHRLPQDPRVTSPARARAVADTLSRMRLAMSRGRAMTTRGLRAPRPAAQIVLGGQRGKFNGCMPGIFEETLYALEAGRPTYVIGGFGGAAGTLASAMLRRGRFDELTIAYHREHSESFRTLEETYRRDGRPDHIEKLFARLTAALTAARPDIASALDNGLDARENGRLMQSDRVAEVVELVQRGLTRRLGRVR